MLDVFCKITFVSVLHELQANSSEALRLDVAVLDQYLVDDTKKLKSFFPSWADVTAFSTFFSSYDL